MKKLFLAIALLASVASCTKDDVINQDKEEIGFGGPFIENSTKAAVDPSYVTTDDQTKNNLTSFKVYGTVKDVNIFNGNTVSKGSSAYETAAWSCDGATQYWVAGANYIFDAVVDATTVNTDINTGLPVSLSYTASTQKDMLHNRVTTTGKPTTNNGLVTFSFTHLLSKVKFTVENTTEETATNYRYTVTGITITNAYTDGKYAVVAQKDSKSNDVAEKTWFDQTIGTQSIADMTIASKTIEECATEVLLIPGATVGVSFNVNVQVKSGDNWVTISSTPVTKTGVVTLQANNAYNFQVTVGLNNKIEFTATTLPTWTTNADENITIQ